MNAHQANLVIDLLKDGYTMEEVINMTGVGKHYVFPIRRLIRLRIL